MNAPNVRPIPPPYPDNVPLLKGALVSISQSTQQVITVPFQYNPASLRRSVKPNTVGQDQGDRSSAVHFSGAATETLSLTAQIDAIDELEDGDATAMSYGIMPQLAALELFAYPTTTEVKSYEGQMQRGSINVVPPLAPHLIFVWGRQRVLPVRLESLSVTEELFDGNLSPISASVALDLRVLTYSDAFPGNLEYNLFFSHQTSMEMMAKAVRPQHAAPIVGVSPDQFNPESSES